MEKINNHDSCTCDFVSKVRVLLKEKEYGAQIWRTKSGEQYCRIFFDESNKKLYWKYPISQIEILS